ncbi:MAG: hypothetical protein AB7K04_10870 [Pseudorhodoplanes sp.]
MKPRFAWPAAAAASLACLLWPSFWNGFPIIFADTGGYLERPFEGTLVMGRSALYGAFLAAGMRLDFWPCLLVQAALATWIIMLLLRVQGLGHRPALLPLCAAALGLLTALPWYVSQLMPDIFIPLSVAAFYILAFHAKDIGRFEAAALVATTAFAIASHMATLALSLALLCGLPLLIAAMRVLPARSRGATWRISFGGPALSIIAGVALALLSNLAIAGQFAFTPGGASFLFGRLIQDGIVPRYLAAHCPDPSIRLCPYRDELPKTADDWLWGNSPFHHLGGDDAYAPEERRIILATLRLYPRAHLTTAAKAAFDQFTLFKTTASVTHAHNNFALDALTRYAPDIAPRLHAARQQQPDGFEIAPPGWPRLRAPVQDNDAFEFVPFNFVHVPVAALAMALLPVIVVLGLRNRLPRSVAGLALTVAFALAANAAISGIFSNPVDRYQSRLIWLAPFCVLIAVLTRSRRIS